MPDDTPQRTGEPQTAAGRKFLDSLADRIVWWEAYGLLSDDTIDAILAIEAEAAALAARAHPATGGEQGDVPLDVETFVAGLDSPNHSPESRKAWIALFYRDMQRAAHPATAPVEVVVGLHGVVCRDRSDGTQHNFRFDPAGILSDCRFLATPPPVKAAAGLREAIRAAASGCHSERWDSDWQDGHTTREWEDCPAWPCSALRAATPPPAEGTPEGLDGDRLARAIHSSNDHPNRAGCLDMDRDTARLLAAEYDRLTREAEGTPEYDDHEFYEDPEPRTKGRCDYTYPDGAPCGAPESFHWHDKAEGTPEGLDAERLGKAIVAHRISQWASEPCVAECGRDIAAEYDRLTREAAR